MHEQSTRKTITKDHYILIPKVLNNVPKTVISLHTKDPFIATYKRSVYIKQQKIYRYIKKIVISFYTKLLTLYIPKFTILLYTRDRSICVHQRQQHRYILSTSVFERFANHIKTYHTLYSGKQKTNEIASSLYTENK